MSSTDRPLFSGTPVSARYRRASFPEMIRSCGAELPLGTAIKKNSKVWLGSIVFVNRSFAQGQSKNCGLGSVNEQSPKWSVYLA
jgi:hypothetical protein